MADVEIVTRAGESALARLDPQALITKALETGAGIDTMERLVALAKDIREVQAKEAWYAAMAEFQRQCPPIKKTRTAKIATARASYSYRYAPLDDILSVIQPVMGQLGLSVSWRAPRVDEKHVIASCRISHTLGHHEESGDVVMPIQIAEDGRGANPMQRVGIATTYCKRYALLSIIGMAPEDDDDAASVPPEDPSPARDEGNVPLPGQGTITEPQQKRFHAIAREHKWSDEQIHELLTAGHLDHVKDIPVARYDAAIDRLKKGPGKA